MTKREKSRAIVCRMVLLCRTGLLLVGVSITASAQLAKIQSVREQDDLEGPVKSVTLRRVIIRSVGGKRVVTDSALKSYITYDVNGGMSEKIKFSEGTVDYRMQYESNERGQTVGSRQYDDDNELTTTFEYQYDSSGHETKYTGYSKSGDRTSWMAIEHDPNGYMSSYTTYGEGDTIEEGGKYTRDSKGKVLVQYDYGTNGRFISRTEYSDTTTIGYDSTNAVLGAYIYTLDKEGRRIRAMEYSGSTDSHGFRRRYDYVRDARGNLLLMSEYRDKAGHFLTSKTSYVYDAEGNWTFKEYSWGNSAYDKDELTPSSREYRQFFYWK